MQGPFSKTCQGIIQGSHLIPERGTSLSAILDSSSLDICGKRFLRSIHENYELLLELKSPD